MHARYKDLAQVEWAFRCAKTTHLDMRPIFVRRADRTRGHALVVMLAYRLIQELASRWSALDLTVHIDMLASLCLVEVQVNGRVPFNQIPQPSQAIQSLLDAARLRLPSALPGKKGRVHQGQAPKQTKTQITPGTYDANPIVVKRERPL